MGFLRTDYSDVNAGFEVLPVGEYECIVSEVKVDKSQTSQLPMLKVTLTIRDDVDQAGKKRKLFDNMVEMDKMMWKFQQVAKACELPEGEELETLSDFAKAIQYKPVCVKLKIEKYNGEDQNRINAWLPSKVQTPSGSVMDDPFASSGPIDLSDDDLPF